MGVGASRLASDERINVGRKSNAPPGYQDNPVDEPNYVFLDNDWRLLTLAVDWALGTRQLNLQRLAFACIISPACASNFRHQYVEDRGSTRYPAACVVN